MAELFFSAVGVLVALGLAVWLAAPPIARAVRATRRASHILRHPLRHLSRRPQR